MHHCWGGGKDLGIKLILGRREKWGKCVFKIHFTSHSTTRILILFN